MLADASGAAAIAQAWRHIVLGEADIAICGGVDTTIEAVPIVGVRASLRIVLSTNNERSPPAPASPFDRDRDGVRVR